MNAANVRALAEVPSGAIAMSNLQGKSNTQYIVASGGTETTSGDWKIHVFNSSGTFTVNAVVIPLVLILLTIWSLVEEVVVVEVKLTLALVVI